MTSMKPCITLALLLAVAASAFSFGALNQTSKPKKKTTAATLGTVQMPGDNGKLKTIYQLGDKNNELHFTLDSAAFATYYPSPDDMLVAGEKERLLVLNFTVQNPRDHEQPLTWSSFRFTAVSPDDVNFECHNSYLQPATKTHVAQTLKPAQKMKCVVVFPIHPTGPVPKLIVKRGDGAVLRYDLAGRVEKLRSVFSPDGIDVNEKGTTTLQPQDTAVMGPYSIKFEGMEYSTETIHGHSPESGGSCLSVKVTFSNPMLKPITVNWQNFTPQLSDDSGVEISWINGLFARHGDSEISQQLAPGESISARYVFMIPAQSVPKTLHFKHNDSKRIVDLAVPAKS